MFHPATLVFLWAGLAVILPSLALMPLLAAAVVAFGCALAFANRRSVRLLRRARWLLLSVALLFCFGTPGVVAPGLAGTAGITLDGLQLAGEHLLRLLILLATLSLLHEAIGTAGFLAGLYWLLAPLAGLRDLRERIVVRLMLVLDFVESGGSAGWRDWLRAADSGPDVLHLELNSARWFDWLLMLGVAGMVLRLAS